MVARPRLNGRLERELSTGPARERDGRNLQWDDCGISVGSRERAYLNVAHATGCRRRENCLMMTAVLNAVREDRSVTGNNGSTDFYDINGNIVVQH